MISAGTLQVGDNSVGGSTTGTLGSGPVTDNANLNFNHSNGLTVANAISGTGTVNQIGTGTLTLSGANTYTGATTVQAGVLQLGSTGALGSAGSHTSSVTVNTGTTLDLNGFSPTAPAQLNLNGTGFGGNGALTNGSAISATYSGPVTLQSSSSIGGTAGDITLSNTVSGASAAGLTKIGTDNLILSGVNNYAGTTTVAGGILLANSNSALGLADGTAATGTTVNAGASLALGVGVTIGNEALTINGVGSNPGLGTFGALGVALAGTATYGGAITVGAGGATISADGGTLTLTGGINKNGVNLTLGGGAGAEAGGTINIKTVGISGASANSDLIVDSTTVNEDVANSYNGKTFIRSTLGAGTGILNTGVLNALPTANGRSTVIMDDSGLGGSTLNIAGTVLNPAGANQSIASLAGAATSKVTLGANTLTIGFGLGLDTNGTAGANFLGVISGTTGGITKDETSTQILGGLNTYTGATIVSNGTLQAGISTNGGNTGGPFGVNSATTVGTGATTATLALNTFNATIGTLSGNANGVIQNGGATASILTFGSGVAIGTTTTFAGQIQDGAGGGTLALVKIGLGTEILSGPNTYAGATTVSGGILQAASNTALGTAVSGTTVNAGATLQLAGGIVIAAEALTINGTGFNAGAGTLGALATTGGTSTYGGPITLGSNATISADGGTLNLLGGVIKTGFDLTLGGGAGSVAGGTINVTTVGISGNTGAFNSDLIVDSVTVNEDVANSYLGRTFIRSTLVAGTGILNTGVANALPTVGGRTSVTMDDSGLGGSTLNIAGTVLNPAGANQSTASLAGAATSKVTLGNNTLTIGFGTGLDIFGTAGANFAGVISGGVNTGGITKDETSTQIFSGANTYTGATIVNGGTLQAGVGTVNNLAGNAISGAFGVNSAVTVQTVAPGVAATLDLAGFSNTIGSLSDGGGLAAGAGTGTVTNSAGGAATLTIATANSLFVPTTTSYGGKITNTGGALSVVINGAGTQSLSSGLSTYTGGTTLNSGTLDIDASSVGGPVGGPPVSGPLGKGALTINGGNIGTGIGTGANNTSTISNAVTVNASFGVTNVVLPVATLGAPNTATVSPPNGPYNVPAGAANFNSDGVAFSGVVTLANAGVTTVNTTSGFLDFTGTIVGAGSGGLSFTGKTLFVHWQRQRRRSAQYLQGHDDRGRCGSRCGTNYVLLGKGAVGSYAIPGNLVITPNGYVQFDNGNGAVSNQINPNANMVVNGTLDTAGLNQGVNVLAGSGTVRLDGSVDFATGGGAAAGAAGILTVNSGLFAGNITGAGGQLTKVTPGILILTGANTYTGNTNINAGILQVDGSTTSANTFVANGAQLQGIGTIGGNVFNHGTVKPGDSPGTLTVKGNVHLVRGRQPSRASNWLRPQQLVGRPGGLGDGQPRRRDHRGLGQRLPAPAGQRLHHPGRQAAG